MAKRHYIPVTADVPGVSDAMRAQIRRTIRTALEAQGVDFPCEIDVLVTSDDGIHEINRTMRDVDRPTDVLSFPEFTLTPGELPSPEDADPGTGTWCSRSSACARRRRSTATAIAARCPIL